ncbi:hypothetical protein, partial [Candidatus Laterigemmans baculatus]|uniref:hypothetical protein n=1 Tax=Candidatus Laterigemmans baculatus TaxID=2770505 RepID=UPI0013D943CA
MASLASRRSPLASRLPVYRQVVHAVVAIVAAAVPAGIALDHGGRFAWSWWLLTVLAIGFVGGAVVGKSSWQRGSWLRWAPPVLLLLLAGFAALQSISLPASLVRTLSPGSAAAHEQWLPAATDQPAPTEYSLSVAPRLSRDFAARAVVVAAFAFVAVVVFANPQLATLLLAALLATGVLHASLGIYQRMTTPGTTLGGIHLGGPFGFFVNRNNAAALLNVALAAAVGLVAWRIRSTLAQVTSHHQPP